MVVKKKAKKITKKSTRLYAVVWPNSDVTVIQATSAEDAIELAAGEEDDEDEAEPLGAMELKNGFRLEMTFTRKEDYLLELEEDSETDIIECVRIAKEKEDEEDDDEEDEDDEDDEEDEDEEDEEDEE